jgi:hypothetical protein
VEEKRKKVGEKAKGLRIALKAEMFTRFAFGLSWCLGVLVVKFKFRF